MSQFIMKVYVGNVPPNHRLMMMGHCQNTFFLAAPKQYPVGIFCAAVTLFKVSGNSIFEKIRGKPFFPQKGG
jgi:hypothetical protein